MISSKRIWTWTGEAPTTITPSWLTISTASANDIQKTAGHIHYTELFPAVRVKNIFEAIENKYSVDFSGTFLSDERFTKLFLWYKNRNEFNFLTEAQTITFDALTTSSNPATDSFNLTDDSIRVQHQTLASAHTIVVNVISLTGSVDYTLDVYQNGNLYQSIPFTTTGNLTAASVSNVTGLDDTYTFKVKSNLAATVDFTINYTIVYPTPPSVTIDYGAVSCNAVTLTAITDLASYSPAMKISDFFSGILKIFNMTCYAIS